MFFLYFLPAIHRVFTEPASSQLNHPMPDPETSEPSPEEQLNHLNQIASYIRSNLTNFHRQWLATHSEALGTSSERVMSDVLVEWLAQHRNATHKGSSLGDILPQALDDFIARHHEEFLPVVLID